ncbi:MAG: hypothetical protein ACLUD1_10430 [Clostridia bacterium]
MIIIRKKRILLVLSFVFIAVFTAVIVNQGGIRFNKETVSTMSLPVSNKVIVLDARTWGSR